MPPRFVVMTDEQYARTIDTLGRLLLPLIDEIEVERKARPRAA